MRLGHVVTLILLLSGMTGFARANEAFVVVISSERSAAYEQAATALSGELPSGQVRQLSLEELPAYRGPVPRLYVALGTEACAQLVQAVMPAPVLCTLLPRASFERLLRDAGRRSSAALSALYLNQPLGRQLDLVRLALPQARRVGVLLGTESQSNEAPLAAAAQSRGLRINATVVRPEEPVYNGLRKILGESDVLLALADPQIYNSGSVQNILLASFRSQVPMLAFAPAYVRAGALMAVYSTPAQIGQQAGFMARGVLAGQPLGLPQHPLQFEVSVNEHVARSLGLKLDAASLAGQLQRLERGS